MLFWALGAYNRLTRLRSSVVQAFGAVDAHLVRLIALLGEFDAVQGHSAAPAAVSGGAANSDEPPAPLLDPAKVAALRKAGRSWTQIAAALRCSKSMAERTLLALPKKVR